MSTHLGTILTFLSSLAIITPIIKFLFLKSYRIHLKRTSLIEKKELLEKYYNESYKQRGTRNKFLLQCDTNILLGEERFSYQTIFSILRSNYQYFYRVISELKYAQRIIKEKKIGNNFILYSPYSKSFLKIIFRIIVSFYILSGLIWLGYGTISLIEYNKIISNNRIDLMMIFSFALTLIAARIRIALELGERLPIQFK